MNKRIIVWLLFVVFVSVFIFQRSKKNQYDEYEFYETSELSSDILQNRNGKVIIERCVGVVTSDDKDGRILDFSDAIHNYISYAGVKSAKKGDKIVTYFVYNPRTNYEDDILERYDYVEHKL